MTTEQKITGFWSYGPLDLVSRLSSIEVLTNQVALARYGTLPIGQVTSCHDLRELIA
jgi:hypothetical protein